MSGRFASGGGLLTATALICGETSIDSRIDTGLAVAALGVPGRGCLATTRHIVQRTCSLPAGEIGVTASGYTLSQVALVIASGHAGDYLPLLPARGQKSQDGWPDEKHRRVLRRLSLSLLLFQKCRWQFLLRLEALFFSVSFQGEDLVLYYDPFFRAETESAANPLPRSVIVPSLSDFAGDLPERVQCPVRAIKFLRKAARSASYIPSRLFVSPWNPERAMSKNAISFYLRQLIIDSGAVSTSRPPRAHDICGIATSLNYYSNLSLSNLMQVATWKSNRVFASRYLKEVSVTQDNIRQFGPLVIAGDRLHPRPPQHKH